MSLVTEYDIKTECRKIILISGRGVLLQSRYSLNLLTFHKGESTIFELKKPGIKGIFNFEPPAPDALHIAQYSIICVTVNDYSFFIDYDMKNYIRYPKIKHHSPPIKIAFIHPCYLYGFYNSSLSIYLIYTGELLETIEIPSLNYNISCASYQNFFISTQNSLIGFSSPSFDVLIPTLLIKKKFDVALEICADTCSYLLTRVYFEYAVNMFFQERDYQRAAHYFRKSEEY